MISYLFWTAVVSATVYILMWFTTRNAALALAIVAAAALITMGSTSESHLSLTVGSAAERWGMTIMRLLGAVAVGVGVIAGVSATRLVQVSMR